MTRSRLTSILTLLFGVCVAGPATADEPAAAAAEAPVSANPDRPTRSAAAATISDVHAQVETGVEFRTSTDANAIAIPVLARVGLADSFEMRLGMPAWLIPLGEDTASTGSLELGAKVAGDVTETLSLGVLPSFTTSGGSEQATAFAGGTYGVLALWGVALGESAAVGGNLGVAVGPSSVDGEGPREAFYSGSLYASYAFTEAFGAGVEGFVTMGEFAAAAPGGTAFVTFAVTPWCVLDVFGSVEMADDTAIAAGAGVALVR